VNGSLAILEDGRMWFAQTQASEIFARIDDISRRADSDAGAIVSMAGEFACDCDRGRSSIETSGSNSNYA
jgi:hypothetical protein